jgi:hypothetical protein
MKPHRQPRTSRKATDPLELAANSQRIEADPNASAQLANALLAPEFSGTQTLCSMMTTEMQLSGATASDITAALSDECASINSGDLAPIERRLSIQGASLDRLYHHLMHTVLNAKLPHDLFERYLRLALKAQAQSSTTLEALANIKQGPRIVIARQANVASQQVVNNNASAEPQRIVRSTQNRDRSRTRARLASPSTPQNATLDPPSTPEAIPSHPPLEAVAKCHRTHQ